MDQCDLERSVEIGDFQIERRVGAGGMGIVPGLRVLRDRSLMDDPRDLHSFQREQFNKSMGISGVDEPSVKGVRISVVIIGVTVAISSAFFLGIGLGLLVANRWARRISTGVYAALAALTLFEMIRVLTQGRVTVDFAFAAVLLAVTGSTITYLWRRSVCDWFRLAARIRAEHGPGVLVGRDKAYSRGPEIV